MVIIHWPAVRTPVPMVTRSHRVYVRQVSAAVIIVEQLESRAWVPWSYGGEKEHLLESWRPSLDSVRGTKEASV